MEIKRIGKYSRVDENGYLINHSNLHTSPKHWLDAITTVKNHYLAKWLDDIHSIYIRGSIAKGTAVDYFSDIDSIAVFKAERFQATDACNRAEVKAWTKLVENQLGTSYPFVAGLETELVPIKNILGGNHPYRFAIKIESSCIHGHNLAEQITPFKINHEIAFGVGKIHLRIEKFLSAYTEEDDHGKKLWMAWLMRRYLRLGMQLVMQDEQLYTRDLFLCYESFAKYYPSQTANMYHALELAINPKIVQEAITFVRDFGSWLVDESDDKLRSWGYTQNRKMQWVFNT